MTDAHAEGHQARRAWLDRERDEWVRAFVGALDDAIQHLHAMIFEEGWDALLAEYGDEAVALRESVHHYERGLAHLFGFVRACGTLADEVAWSSMKTEYRRTAVEADVEITLRTALETSLYAAERVPLGDHALWLAGTDAMMLFLYQAAADAAPHPGVMTALEDQLRWAYGALQAFEEHAAFHAAFVAYVHDPHVRPIVEALTSTSAEAIANWQAGLLPLTRFDLLMNTSLVWLASAVARTPIERSD